MVSINITFINKFMRICAVLFFVLALDFGLMYNPVITRAAAGDVEINEPHFPNEGFRRFVKQFDTNNDKILSKAERDLVTSMVIKPEVIELFSVYDFVDMTGIEYFDKLEKLEIRTTSMKSIDLSSNVLLKELICENNDLEKLDLSKNTYLEVLDCGGNYINQLDVGNNIYLKELNCRSNQLEKLDVSNNICLKELNCSSNQLEKLDVSANVNLTRLNCCYNEKMSNLDVRSNLSLENLFCYCMALTELDVSNNVALKNLYCSANQLEVLDVTNNINLEGLECADNNLSELEVSSNVKLYDLTCYDNDLTRLDLSNNSSLTFLCCYNNRLKSLDISGIQNMNALYCYDNELTTIINNTPLTINELYCWGNDFDRLSITLTNSSTELFPTAPCNAFDSYTAWGKNIRYDSVNGALIVAEAGERTDEEKPADVSKTEDDSTGVGQTGGSSAGGSSVSGAKQTGDTGQTSTGQTGGSTTGGSSVSGTEQTDDTGQTSTGQTGGSSAGGSTASGSSAVDTGQIGESTASGSSGDVTAQKEDGYLTGIDNATNGQPQMVAKLDTTITAKSFKKTFGSKSFSLGAVTNSDGVLSYYSDNTKAVAVSDTGKVKITGCGKANITITSSETDTYKTVSETVTVTVLPGKLKIKKISSPRSSQLSFSWAKMQGATEYQYSISESKSFKKAPKFSGKSTTVKKKASGASGRKFYVRARAGAKIDGKKHYGKWSNVKSVTVK